MKNQLILLLCVVWWTSNGKKNTLYDPDKKKVKTGCHFRTFSFDDLPWLFHFYAILAYYVLVHDNKVLSALSATHIYISVHRRRTSKGRCRSKCPQETKITAKSLRCRGPLQNIPINPGRLEKLTLTTDCVFIVDIYLVCRSWWA